MDGGCILIECEEYRVLALVQHCRRLQSLISDLNESSKRPGCCYQDQGSCGMVG
jgi:hypothetical protein